MENKETTPAPKTPFKERFKKAARDFGPYVIYGGLLSVSYLIGQASTERRTRQRVDDLELWAGTVGVFHINEDGTYDLVEPSASDIQSEITED